MTPDLEAEAVAAKLDRTQRAAMTAGHWNVAIYGFYGLGFVQRHYFNTLSLTDMGLRVRNVLLRGEG